MDYKQTYEILLQTICENDRRILQALAHLTHCDDALLEVSLNDEPNPVHLQALSCQKERLIQQLDSLTSDKEKFITQLNSIAALCNEVTAHPLYLKICMLHDVISERMSAALLKEDINNPAITQHLENYMDKLEMDIRISEIPMEKRRIFYLYPNI